MAIDLTIEPWQRLAKLAPPGTSEGDLQVAAQRWAITADVYAAAADLWEEMLLTIDFSPDEERTLENPGPVSAVSQDGIRVDYAVSNQSGNTQNARRSQSIQIRTMVRRLRAKAKPYTPLVHSTDYNPWVNEEMPQDIEDRIIFTDGV